MAVFSYYFWTFMFGSVLGVIVETIWCLIKNRRFESRKGLIYGPFNPLYGVATVALSFSINCISNKEAGNIFIIGVVIASTIEYLCSYYQEKVVGTVSWNYEQFKFNLKGRINLVYSIFWGFLTIAWSDVFMPIVDDYMPVINAHPKATIWMFMFIILDCLISLAASIRRKHRRENIAAKTPFQKHLDRVYTDELMEKIYPNSEFVDD